MRTRVIVATLPSLGEGGVGSLLRFVTGFFDPDVYDVDIVTNTAASSDAENLSIGDIFRVRWKIGISQSSWKGMEVLTVGRRFAYLEPLHYIGNAKEWSQLAKNYDIHIVVAGFNQCGFTFARSGHRFISWLATTFDDDRKGRKEAWPRTRQWVDTLWSPLLRGTESYILRKCNRNLAVSNYTAHLIASRYKLPSSKLKVMTYPIDTDWFSPAKNGNGLDIVSVGRWYDPRKNIGMLLKAFSKVSKNIPESRLILAGSVPERLPEMIKAHGIDESRVFVPGNVSAGELKKLYRSGAVYALSSHQEGLGIVGLEAMACGLPVVSTRCGGPEEYVLDGATGHLVPVDDHEAMAEKLTDLLQDTRLRKDMSVNAREHVLKRHSIPAVSAVFNQALTEVWPEFFG